MESWQLRVSDRVILFSFMGGEIFAIDLSPNPSPTRRGEKEEVFYFDY
jgi:hypothetical protein